MLILFTNCLTVFRFIAPKCITSFWPCWSIKASSIKDGYTDNLMSMCGCREETRAPSGAAEHRTHVMLIGQIKEGWCVECFKCPWSPVLLTLNTVVDVDAHRHNSHRKHENVQMWYCVCCGFDITGFMFFHNISGEKTANVKIRNNHWFEAVH